MSVGNVAVIGAGAWGTALAQAAAMAGNRVILIARDKGVADEVNSAHRNSAYLGGQVLNSGIAAVTSWMPLEGAGLVLSAVPAQATRAVLSGIPAALRGYVPVIATAKGFEAGTLALQSAIIADTWPEADAMVLSGPSFAADVSAGRPTAVTLAGEDTARVREVAESLASASFRPYVSTDRTGVELAGGLKNVYALAAGAVEGADLGLSARSALLARAHAEMSRLVVKLGGEAATLNGLAGLGDLALSCTSARSRNYAFGLRLGAGQTLEAIMAERPGLCEGVLTAPVARDLARQNGVEVPLIEAVTLLLDNRMDIGELVTNLMSRPLKKEAE